MSSLPHRSWLVHRAWLRSPDVGRIFPDRAIAGELAGMSHIENRPARPGFGLSIELTDLLLGSHVGREVRKMHVVIAVRQQGIPDRAVDSGLAPAKGPRADQIEGSADLQIALVMPAGVVPAARALDLLGGQAEEEEVLLAGRRGHLDGRPVARADGQGA